MFKPLIASLFILAASLPASAEINSGFGRTTSVASRIQSRAEVCTQDNQTKLSLHNGPGSGFQKLTEITNGEKVGLLGSEYSRGGWWWNISYKNRRGWVSGNYLCK
ncbi:MAG: SH3 domain-containing protein [Methylacidiphilales bacterium]|nr:SH3 domain-containing protein [Candidatus Methylacidiphilales bacterium]NJR15173.1 SH3 domain-containing protein [Calothrix sp. CSU_2_0]